MRYVLDSSVALKVVLPEPNRDKAIRLRDETRQGLHESLAPDVFPVELAHALTKAERQGRIPQGDGLAHWQTVMADPPVLHPDGPLMTRAFDIASANRVGFYDCLYVALAEREGCKLVTADDRLVRNLGARFPFIVALASLP